MSKNRDIVAGMRTYFVILLGFIVFETLIFFITRISIGNALSSVDGLSGIVPYILIFTILWSILIDAFFIKRIIDLKPLLTVEPIKCSVEDFIVTGHASGDGKHYNVSLLLKNIETQEFLFTYGKHSLSYYNYTHSASGAYLTSVNIFRGDGTFLEIGDIVNVYIEKYVDVNVDLDDDMLKLDGKTLSYSHKNEMYDKSVFDKVKFYRGAVDVKRMQE